MVPVAKDFVFRKPMVMLITSGERKHVITVIFPDKSRKEFAGDGITGEALLVELGLNPYETILSRNGYIIPEDARIFSGDEIRLIAIVHGG